MKEKLLTVLQQSDRKDILKEFETLRTAPTFNDYADIWSIGLYKFDPLFFKSFIKYNLRRDLHLKKPFMKELLALADAQKDFDFYQWLYPFIFDQKKWNDDLKNICNIPDDKLFEESIEKLTVNNFWSIDETVAIALYKRSPALSKPVILAGMPFRWGNKSLFKNLRQVIKEHKDDTFYWSLYKKLGNVNDWLQAIDELIKTKKKQNIIDELENTTIENWYGYSNDILKVFDKIYDHYGTRSLPYIKNHINFLRFTSQDHKDKFLDKIRQKESEELYLELFMLVCHPKQWQDKIDEILLNNKLSKVAKIHYLHYLSNSAFSFRYFPLSEPNALKIYDLSPEILLKYFSDNLNGLYHDLYCRAIEDNNQDLVDIIILSTLKLYYYPKQNEKMALKFHNTIINNLESLRLQSPLDFVKRISLILSRYNAHDIWNLKALQSKNKLVDYIFNLPEDLWLKNHTYIRDLLESPNIYVQIKAFEILHLKDPETLIPIRQNIDILLATILKRYYKRTLTTLFEVLEYGIINDPDIARIALPKLVEALTIKAKKYPRDKIIALLGRLKYYNPELASSYI